MRSWLRGAVVIPLTASAGWQTLNFSHIPPNRIQFAANGIHVTVNKSAGALILPLNTTKTVRAFEVRLKINGEINRAQTAWPEDAYLRVGLVVPGSRKPNAFERMFAPSWIKQLFRLAPKDSGIDQIRFFELVSAPAQIGQSRVFPKSKDLMKETIALRAKPDSDSTYAYTLLKPAPTSALWLSVDGDDTKSSFDIWIEKLSLTAD